MATSDPVHLRLVPARRWRTVRLASAAACGAAAVLAWILRESALSMTFDPVPLGIGLAALGAALVALPSPRRRERHHLGDIPVFPFPWRVGGPLLAVCVGMGTLLFVHRLAEPPERVVTFDSDGVTLAGTVTAPPRGSGLGPGVVIVQATARELGATRRFHARYLARRGITTLRWDPRGRGASGGDAAGSVPDRHARDAAQALRFLRTVPGVDPDRVGLLGFGEAEWVVPVAARDAQAAFVALVGASGLSPIEQEREEVRMRLDRAGFGSGVIDEALALHEAVVGVTRSGGAGAEGDEVVDRLRAARATPWHRVASRLPDRVPSGPDAERLRARQDVEPAQLWRDVPPPVLLLNGSEDMRAAAADAQDRITGWLTASGNRVFDAEILPGADHELVVWRLGPGVPPPHFPRSWPSLLPGWIRAVTGGEPLP